MSSWFTVTTCGNPRSGQFVVELARIDVIWHSPLKKLGAILMKFNAGIVHKRYPPEVVYEVILQKKLCPVKDNHLVCPRCLGKVHWYSTELLGYVCCTDCPYSSSFMRYYAEVKGETDLGKVSEHLFSVIADLRRYFPVTTTICDVELLQGRLKLFMEEAKAMFQTRTSRYASILTGHKIDFKDGVVLRDFGGIEDALLPLPGETRRELLYASHFAPHDQIVIPLEDAPGHISGIVTLTKRGFRVHRCSKLGRKVGTTVGSYPCIKQGKPALVFVDIAVGINLLAKIRRSNLDLPVQVCIIPPMTGSLLESLSDVTLVLPERDPLTPTYCTLAYAKNVAEIPKRRFRQLADVSIPEALATITSFSRSLQPTENRELHELFEVTRDIVEIEKLAATKDRSVIYAKVNGLFRTRRYTAEGTLPLSVVFVTGSRHPSYTSYLSSTVRSAIDNKVMARLATAERFCAGARFIDGEFETPGALVSDGKVTKLTPPSREFSELPLSPLSPVDVRKTFVALNATNVGDTAERLMTWLVYALYALKNKFEPRRITLVASSDEILRTWLYDTLRITKQEAKTTDVGYYINVLDKQGGCDEITLGMECCREITSEHLSLLLYFIAWLQINKGVQPATLGEFLTAWGRWKASLMIPVNMPKDLLIAREQV